MARDEITARISGLTEDLAAALRYRLLELRSELSAMGSSRAFDEVQLRIRGTAQRFDDALYAMESAMRRKIKRQHARHSEVMMLLRDADIRRALAERRGRLGVLAARLKAAAGARIDHAGEAVSVASGKLDSLSPLAVLSRGYAIAFDDAGRVIKRAADVRSGDRLRIRVADGELDCTRD
jgi:exodeoxyribonuclease VII large subunit